jgi:hypothetical protein
LNLVELRFHPGLEQFVDSWLIAGGVLAVLLGGLAALSVTAGSRTVFVCPHCTTRQTRWYYLGFSGRYDEANEFTEWFLAHRPAHQHSWERCSCTRGYNALGMTTYWGCAPVHPVSTVPPELLREFAEQADSETLDAYFRDVASDDPKLQEQAVSLVWGHVEMKAEAFDSGNQ